MKLFRWFYRLLFRRRDERYTMSNGWLNSYQDEEIKR